MPSLADPHGGLENGARLHLGDFGIEDAEAAAAQAQHRVELVQLFDARSNSGSLVSSLPRRIAVRSDFSFFLISA